MKFAENGYYIEQYIKCDNCGVLIYDDGKTDNSLPGARFCSRWCIEWRNQRNQGIDIPRVDLPFEQ